MGLDAFLIPQDHSPPDHQSPTSDQDGTLPSPLLILDSLREMLAAPVSGGMVSPGSNLGRRRDERTGKATPGQTIDLTPLTDSGFILSPIAIDPSGRELDAEHPSAAFASNPRRHDHRSYASIPGFDDKLGDFLAIAANPPTLFDEDVKGDPREFLATSPLDHREWNTRSPLSTSSADGNGWSASFPSPRANLPLHTEYDPSTPMDTRQGFDRATGSSGPGDDAEPIEDRLERVTARLERAAERLDAPANSLDQRPRPFRGRIGS